MVAGYINRLDKGDEMKTHPFGTKISTDDIIGTLAFFDDWEDRYKYIIELGKELPGMPSECKTDDKLVAGCQSQVWIEYCYHHGRLQLNADSDAFIVKGLLAIVLAAYHDKTYQYIGDFNIREYFSRLNLLQHLSPSRSNGLVSMVKRIQDIASAYQATKEVS